MITQTSQVLNNVSVTYSITELGKLKRSWVGLRTYLMMGRVPVEVTKTDLERALRKYKGSFTLIKTVYKYDKYLFITEII